MTDKSKLRRVALISGTYGLRDRLLSRLLAGEDVVDAHIAELDDMKREVEAEPDDSNQTT